LADDRARRREQFPLGAALTWDVLEDLGGTDALHAVRADEPVTWCDALGGWLVTERELVREVYESPHAFTVEGEQNYVRRVLGDMMLVNDGAEHERHRAPFHRTFALRPVKERFTDLVEAAARTHLDRIAAAGAADLRATFARPFAIDVGARVLGLQLGDTALVAEVYDDLAAAMTAYDDEPRLRRGLEARDRIGAELRHLLATPGRTDQQSPIATAAAAFNDEEELVSNARVILFGAIETVESMLLNTVWALLRTPDALRRVQDDPALIPAAIDESLRWLPPVGFVERWAVDDVVLGGVAVARGEFVIAALIAANRDPAHFPDPDRFDLDRPNARHAYAFGHGTHHCLGFNLARLQGRVGLEQVLARLPGLRLDETRPCRPHGFGGRRMEALHVRWEPTETPQTPGGAP
jgi:cytochrome P450